MATTLISWTAMGLGAGSSVSWAQSPPKVLMSHSWRRIVDRTVIKTPAYTHANLIQDFAALHRSRKAQTVEMVVGNAKTLKALAAFSQEVNTPGSPNYHRYLTPAQLLSRFGPNQQSVASAETAVKAAGWRVLNMKGMVLSAVAPAGQTEPSVPYSADIWSLNGLRPTRAVNHVSKPPTMHIGVPSSTPMNVNTVLNRDSSSLSAYDFAQNPSSVFQTVTNAGDTLSVISWNPQFQTTLPSGLPFNLVITAQSDSGQPLAITQIGNPQVSDAEYEYDQPAALADSQQTLWRTEIAVGQGTPNGQTLSLAVTLSNGNVGDITIPLPDFTGDATVLPALTGRQMTTLADADGVEDAAPAASRPAVGILTLGQIPSVAGLSQLMDEENLPMPNLSFDYFDGATSSMQSTADYTESEEDVQAVASSDPGGTIQELVYPSSEANVLVDALNYLANQQAIKILSSSYGFFGYSSSTLEPLVDACAAEGISLVFSSGDKGAWDAGQDPGAVGVGTLLSQSSVISVGGVDWAAPAVVNQDTGVITSVETPAINRAWGGDFVSGLPTEVAQVYTAPNAVSSGGYGVNSVPSWQQGVLPLGATGIGVPDFSALAGAPYDLMVLNGQPYEGGGTSLAAPLTAGWLADVEGALGLSTTGLGNISPMLFQLAQTDPQDFARPLWGSDGAYDVGPSSTWNPMTGLGVPNWDAVASSISAPVPTVSSLAITLQSASVMPNTPDDVSVLAIGPDGNPLTSYNGAATITSSDNDVALSQTPTFVNGAMTVAVTMSTTGTQTLTISTGANSGLVSGISLPVNVAPPSSLAVTGSHALSNTSPLTLTVTAFNAAGNPVMGAPMNFSVTGGLTLSTFTATSNSQGEVQVTVNGTPSTNALLTISSRSTQATWTIQGSEPVTSPSIPLLTVSVNGIPQVIPLPAGLGVNVQYDMAIIIEYDGVNLAVPPIEFYINSQGQGELGAMPSQIGSVIPSSASIAPGQTQTVILQVQDAAGNPIGAAAVPVSLYTIGTAGENMWLISVNGVLLETSEDVNFVMTPEPTPVPLFDAASLTATNQAPGYTSETLPGVFSWNGGNSATVYTNTSGIVDFSLTAGNVTYYNGDVPTGGVEKSGLVTSGVSEYFGYQKAPFALEFGATSANVVNQQSVINVATTTAPVQAILPSGAPSPSGDVTATFEQNGEVVSDGTETLASSQYTVSNGIISFTTLPANLPPGTYSVDVAYQANKAIWVGNDESYTVQ